MVPALSRDQIEAAMTAFEEYKDCGAHSELFGSFGEPRDYWVRSSRERENRVYPTKPIVAFARKLDGLNGGWSTIDSAAAALHNAGFVVVNAEDQPVDVPEKDHLLSGADRIRLCALTYFIEPAREKAARTVSIRAGDLAAAMGLHDVFPNICQALGGEKFQKLAQVPPPTSTEPNPSSSTVFTFTLNAQPEADTAMKTLNTILYGPPGTGKTYATFRKAVEICDGPEAVAAMDGDTLKARYAELREAGRIGFVTFHQSYSYEEFVEGLRPEGGDGEAGFTLEPRNGVLREIAASAHALSRKADSHASRSDLANASFFKMSQGRKTSPDEAAIVEECLDRGEIRLDRGGDLDWSDPEFGSKEKIQATLAERSSNTGDTGKDSHLTSDANYIDLFRNRLKVGNYVIVPHGFHNFRAIGRVTGEYEFDKDSDVFSHRRKVDWLWRGEPLPVSQIYHINFSKLFYRLDTSRLNLDTIASLISDPKSDHTKQPFVLVIDEINRANISKVFGELITLLEEDKRAGAENEVSVRLPYSGDDFTLPANLHILGTMNTADRSIALLDTALRRRFHFEETPPRPKLLKTVDGIDLPLLLTRLNQRIEYLVDRDHLIGHAFFIACNTRDDVDTVMRRKVIPLLAEYFHEDWEHIVAVLGGKEQGFIAKEALTVPPGLHIGMDEARYRYTVRGSFPPDAYAGLQA